MGWWSNLTNSIIFQGGRAQPPISHISPLLVGFTWWLIPLSKWVITPIISGLTLQKSHVNHWGYNPLTIRGMSHQVLFNPFGACEKKTRNFSTFSGSPQQRWACQSCVFFPATADAYDGSYAKRVGSITSYARYYNSCYMLLYIYIDVLYMSYMLCICYVCHTVYDMIYVFIVKWSVICSCDLEYYFTAVHDFPSGWY